MAVKMFFISPETDPRRWLEAVVESTTSVAERDFGKGLDRSIACEEASVKVATSGSLG